MAQEEAIKLFEGKQVRYVWDDEAQKYYEEVKNIEEKNKDKNIDQMYKETVIRIKPKQMQHTL